MNPKLPIVQVAVFCERVLEERDGVLTPVRIVDKVIVERTAEEKRMPVVTAILFVSLRGGEFRGTGKLEVLRLERDGTASSDVPVVADLPFVDAVGAINVVADVSFRVQNGGTHWFTVNFNGEQLTKMPLTVELLAAKTTKTELAPAPGADQESSKR